MLWGKSGPQLLVSFGGHSISARRVAYARYTDGELKVKGPVMTVIVKLNSNLGYNYNLIPVVCTEYLKILLSIVIFSVEESVRSCLVTTGLEIGSREELL